MKAITAFLVFRALLCIPGFAADATLRSLRVELPGLEQNVVKKSWPGIGCWFWTAEEFRPDGYKRFLDLHEKYSGFALLTTSIRHPVEVTDPKVHDQIKAAANYARERGMDIVMDLDVRLARQEFMDKYPGEMQEIVRLREIPLQANGTVTLSVASMNLGDHYTFKARGYDAQSARLLRAYSYVSGTNGVDPTTVQDISTRCQVSQADAKGLAVSIPDQPEDSGRTACILAAFTLFTPDVFAPHLIEFERNILKQYADTPLAGACKDEWGFPGRFGPRLDDLYFSSAMAKAYAQRRIGRDLVRDLVLLVKPHKDLDAERAAAINHWMEMNWQRNAEVENAFHQSIKEVFGAQALSATHPTWVPNPSSKEEVFKNGLDWWAVQRDLAQTDEATPFCARTALAKKWQSPLWFNMYYDRSIVSYQEDLWRHALGGGRMNFHPLYPNPGGDLTTSLLSGPLLAADSRVRLLNFISTAPIDCPVAVVFGHPAALNWAGPGLADAGLAVTDGLWAEGFYADLIPSSEIAAGNLKIASDGRIQYGPQRYSAVVLYHPQYERPVVVEFFRKAAVGRGTALFRVGDWTADFEGQAFDAGVLPPQMKPVAAAMAVQQAIAHLKAAGIAPQTTCTARGVASFPGSMMPRPRGQCRLLDGTVIVASGEKNVMGDPIQQTLAVNGHEVTIDAVGVAATRLDKTGKLEALAAAGLRSFRGGGLTITLSEPVDVALWRDAKDQWQGVLHGQDSPVPEALVRITRNWTRLRLPAPLGQDKGS
jgi:hypothetical protein